MTTKLITIALSFAATSAFADTIAYNSIDLTNSSAPFLAGGWGVNSGSTFSSRFTSAATGKLTTIDLALNSYSSSNTGNAKFTLYTDASPSDSSSYAWGTALATFSVHGTGNLFNGSSRSTVTYDASSLDLYLTTGGNYWLSASPLTSSDKAVWNQSSIAHAPYIQVTAYGTYQGGSVNAPAYTVHVDAVPEPSAYAMSAFGLLFLVTKRKRKATL